MNFPFKLIDLSHIVSSSCPTWNGDCGFSHEVVLDYSDCNAEVKFRVQKMKMNAGIGTHIDAPAHCFPTGKTVDQLHLDELLSPCIVIDVSDKANADYVLSVEDIQQFEAHHGDIPSKAFVIVYMGWSRFWHDSENYRYQMQFSSISKFAAEYLLAKNISGLGIDTLSPDTPDSGFPVHHVILGAGKYIVENVANANLLPATGSFVLVMPMRIEGGTEAPVRLVGLVEVT